MPIAVTPGFRDDNPTSPFSPTYGTTRDASATPELWRLTKTYLGPESETATGPNYKRRYRLDVDIAPGQTVTNLQITDTLANSMQWTGAANVVMTVHGGTVTTNTTGSTATTTTPGGTVRGNFGTVVGAAGVDASLVLEFFVPRDRSGGAEVLPQPTPPAPNPGGGTDSDFDTNTGSSSADWTPLDFTLNGRDAPAGQPISKTAPDNGPHQLQEHSVATQKSVIAVTAADPNTPITGPILPGQTLLRYTINFQVSDYYAVNNLFLEDVLGDGQKLYLASGFTPTLVVQNPWTFAGGGTRAATSSGVFSGGNTIDYERRYSINTTADSDPTVGVEGYSAAGPTGGPFNLLSPGAIDGTTFLRFNISDELIARGLPGLLVGGEIANGGSNPFNNNPTAAFGAAQGTITFWVQVKEEFSDDFPSTDNSVDQGDTLTNDVPLIQGDHLSPTDLADGTPTPLGTVGTDDTGAGVAIDRGLQTKTIYAINGTTIPTQAAGDIVYSVQAGDRVTYKLTYTLPISRFENLEILDIPPLPVMPVGLIGSYTFDRIFDGSFNNYEIEVAPDDTFFDIFDGTSGNPLFPSLVPGTTITTNPTTNTITMSFGDFDDPQDQFTTVSLLVTLPVGDDAFEDDVFLTNQLRINEGNTFLGTSTVEDLRRFELVRPFVSVYKGAVAANNSGQTVGSGSSQIVFAPASNPTGRFTLGGSALGGTNAVDSIAEAGLIGGLNITTGATPMDLRVDAGDLVRYAIVAQNTGRGDAFNVRISDTIPAGYERPATVAGLNLRLVRGDGTPLVLNTDYTIVSYDPTTGQFEIELTDNYTAGNQNMLGRSLDERSGALSRGESTPAVSADEDPSVTPTNNGSNTVIVFYDVRVVDDPATPPEVMPTPNVTITNTASVTRYSTSETGPDLTNMDYDGNEVIDTTDPTVTANVTIELPALAKTLIDTEVGSLAGSVPNPTGGNQSAYEAPGNGDSQATIGELVYYDLVLTVPEGFTPGANIFDRLDEGLAFAGIVSVTLSSSALTTTGPVLTFAGNGAVNAGLLLATTAVGGSNSRDITFTLGDITNTNVDNSVAETITIRYRVVVVNSNSLPLDADGNQAGETRNNSARFRWTNNNTTLGTVSAANVTLVEPTLTPTKQVTNVTDGIGPAAVVTGDAGDVIRYAITITNGNAAADTTAFDLILSDLIPSSVIGLSIVGGVGGTTSTGTIRFNGTTRAATAADFQLTGQLLEVLSGLSIDMEKNSSITIVVQGTFTGATGDVIPNTAEVRWSSLDGDPGNRAFDPPGATLPQNGTERTGADGSLTSGTLNNYRNQSTANIESPSVVRKTIIATSETHTTPNPINAPGVTNAQAAVGELIRYRLYVSVGEGTSRNFQIQDSLPAGVRFLNDGTARYGFLRNANLVSTGVTNITGLGNAGSIVGDGSSLATLDSSSLTGTFNDDNIATSFNGTGTGEGGLYASGEDVFFRFGNIQNSDSDINLEFVVVEFNALVENVSGNQAGVDLDNSFAILVDTLNSNDGVPGYISVTIDEDGSGTRSAGDTAVTATDADNDAGSGTDTPAFSNVARATVVEPPLTINKQVIATTGNVVTYRVTVGNPSSATAATAFTTHVVDALDGVNLTLASGPVNVQLLGGASGFTNNTSGNTIDLTIDVMPVGSSVVFEYTANVTPLGPEPLTTETIPNTATATFTGLSGDHAATPFFGTLAGTLGGSGSETGERNGTTAPLTLNDYLVSETEQLGSLGNRVFFDRNGDGVQDANEPGLENVPVTVIYDANNNGTFGDAGDSTIATTTSTNGEYYIHGLPIGGTFQVSVPATLGGSGNFSVTDAVDNGVLTASNSSTVTLTLGTPNARNQDFGYRGAGSIGDKIFLDVDNDGQFDTGEGIANVEVTLSGDADGDGTAETFTVTTDTDGTYLFGGLPFNDLLGNAITWTVTVNTATLPPGVSNTVDPDGGLNSTSTNIVLSSATPNNLAQDFGYRGPGSVGDTVFLDVNDNGLPDVGEGIAGVTVQLVGDFDNDGQTETVTATTDTDGLYLFSGLVVDDGSGGSKTYTVDVVEGTLPASVNTTPTVDPQGPLDGTANATLSTAAPADLTRDFGYRGPGSVGDTVFLDVNDNGVPDPGEGIAGVTVTLTGDLDGDGQDETVTATTDTDGLYLFGGLRVLPGGVTYAVNVDSSTLPPGVSQTVDPDGTLNNQSTATLTTASPTDLTRDFGYRGPGSVGDTIFLDVNDNGLPDAGEGIAGLSVQLTGDFDNDGANETVTATTDTDGQYLFSGLVVDDGAGGSKTYTVAVNTGTLPQGVTQTVDPDATLNNQSTATLSTAAPVDLTRDFGYRGPGSVGDTIFLDVNNNGVADPGEGIANVTITLTGDLDNDGQIETITTTTDTDGRYLFGGLVVNNGSGGSKTYTVDVDETTLPISVNTTPTADPQGALDGTAIATLSVNAPNDLTRDFGYRGPGSIGDTIFLDMNNSGTPNAGEGIPNIQVILTGDIDGDGDIDTLTATTDANGVYLFSGLRVLPAGVPYTVTVNQATLPVTYIQTVDPDGTLDHQSSVLLTDAVTTDLTRDFGYRGGSSIGGYVYVDLNDNGVRQPGAGEEGIRGIKVTLTGRNIAGQQVTLTTRTEADGSYFFRGLLPGTYSVIQSQPRPYVDGRETVGSEGGQVKSDRFEVSLGQNIDAVRYNFGELQLSSLTGVVYRDINRDGRLDPRDRVLPGSLLVLTGRDITGATVRRTVRAGAGGRYQFPDLLPGTYVVQAYLAGPGGMVRGRTSGLIVVPPGVTEVRDFAAALGADLGSKSRFILK